MAEGGKPLSFQDIMNEQMEEERTSLQRLEAAQSQPGKVKSKRNKKKVHCVDDDDSVLRGPFEDSFDAALAQNAATSRQSVRLSVKPKEVNDLAKQVISESAEANHYVSLELVKAKMCQMMGVRSLKEVGFRNPDLEVPELKELQRLHSKV